MKEKQVTSKKGFPYVSLQRFDSLGFAAVGDPNGESASAYAQCLGYKLFVVEVCCFSLVAFALEFYRKLKDPEQSCSTKVVSGQSEQEIASFRGS